MKFEYRARTKTGELRTGIIEASTKDNALRLLQSIGLFVISVEEIKPSFWDKIFLFQKISERDIIFFTRSLSTLVNAGVPLLEALDAISVQTKKASFRNIIQEITDAVEGGMSLSRALLNHPQIFSSFYINQIKCGEISGNLGETLEALADFLERQHNFKGQLIGGMIYPLLIIFMALFVLFFMSIFVFPKLKPIFIERGVKLPLLTKIVLFLANFSVIIFALLILFLFSIPYLLKRKEIQEFFQKNFFKIPLISSFLKEIYLSRFSQSLYSLLSAGLHLVDALENSADLIGNEIYKKEILEIKEEVKKGVPFSFALSSRSKFFTPFFIQLVQAGEKSGALVETLKKFSEFSQKEIERKLDYFLKIFEPLLIILIAIGVGFFVAAVILPFYQTITKF
jgi:type IV pilus assembly protein PilC